MADSYTFGNSISNFSSEKEPHVFLEKDLQYITDSNSRNYSRNEVTFDTVTLSNNGRFVDYKEAFISIPVVIHLESTEVISDSDALECIRMKNNLALVDSVSVTYNNTTLVQETAEVASHLIFKQHTTMSKDDLTRADVFGHVKDSSSWTYESASGLMNSAESTASLARLESPWQTEHNADVLSLSNIQASGSDNCQHVSDKIHVFYYDCKIMLKDLSTVFEKMPLLKGANVRISLRLNQGSVTTVSVAAAAGANAAPAVPHTKTVSSNLKGSAFPVMRLKPPVTAYTETITVSVGKHGDAYQHNKKECRLYVPVYQLATSFESQYMALGSKKIVYDDVYINHVRNVGKGAFSNLITNGLSRTKRLIVVPMLSREGNGTSKQLPTESPYCSAPATVSPQFCKMNVKVSGRNVYPSNVEYKYEHFMNELGGKFGQNGGMERGASSSLISMKDYENVFGYFCVDLSRRHTEDDSTPLSLELFGSVESSKALDFLCIVEYEKDCQIDISTGQLVNA